MREIKLERRYPESRQEDITDAYMRGVEFGMALGRDEAARRAEGAGSGGTQMTNAIPFDEWLNEQGDDIRVAMCDCHPKTLILVDTTDFAVYRYVIDRDMDGLSEAMEELMKARVIELGIEVCK